MFDIRMLQDINLNELSLKQKYYDFFINGNIEEAKKIIDDNPELKFKVVNAENLNKLIEHILLLENTYFDNVDNVLNNHLSNYQISINDLIYLQDYSNTYQYNKNNFVLYNHEMYYCISKPPIGTNPTNKTYWVYLGLKGEDSYYPLGIKYQGNWSSSKSYNKYDAVVYKNKLFVAKIDNLNKNPEESLEEWSLEIYVEEQGIFVSRTEPANMKIGNIWFQIFEETNDIYWNENNDMYWNMDNNIYWM